MATRSGQAGQNLRFHRGRSAEVFGQATVLHVPFLQTLWLVYPDRFRPEFSSTDVTHHRAWLDRFWRGIVPTRSRGSLAKATRWSSAARKFGRLVGTTAPLVHGQAVGVERPSAVFTGY